jgi:hypothetical protein
MEMKAIDKKCLTKAEIEKIRAKKTKALNSNKVILK